MDMFKVLEEPDTVGSVLLEATQARINSEMGQNTPAE
jgi:hypothetical protein